MIHVFLLNNIGSLQLAARITETYLGLYVLNSFIFLGLYKLKETQAQSLGFLFMFGSALKFIFFFIFLYPIYKSDGVLTKIEFFTFFIPYAVSLIHETIYLVRILNQEK